MARNGSGTYSNPYPNFVSGTVISSSETDANNSAIATALTQSIAVDGQSTVTANLPLNSKKLTGLAAGTAAADSISLGQAQAEAFVWCGTAGGSADAITLSPSPAITAYAAGQRFVWMASGSANTGATTVAISGLGAIALQDNGAALVAGNHAAGKMFMGILNTTSTVQIMQVQSSGTDPLIVSSLTVSGTSVLTGVTTHGGNVVSDTDSTDDLGTTGVRWANTWTDTVNGVTSPTAQYTSAEETKLAGIEASADVTDATNVASALSNGVAALTSGEVTQLANIGTETISAAEWGYVAASTQAYDSADHTKLNGIEALADVTDATNVLAGLAGQEVVATGFTGTLDGVLGGGTPAAATVTTIDASGVATATTFEPDGDTSAGDNAAMGYTSVLGAILTGQGSTNDVTLVNDADATVLGIPTGTTNVAITGDITANNFAGRNLIINGDMAIAQRGTSIVTPTNTVYLLDRYKYFTSGTTAAVTVTQDSDMPTGHIGFSMKVDCTTADASVAAGDVAGFHYYVEGFDSAHLAAGTAAAKTITISFWVKSPKTGGHGVIVKNGANNRAYPASYTVSVADTWEYKTMTVAMDTSGTWIGATNGIGLGLYFPLIAGSSFTDPADAWVAAECYGINSGVNILDNTANNFYLTELQVEVGTAATEFERIPYATQLAKCQRYLPAFISSSGSSVIPGGGVANTTSTAHPVIFFPVPARVPPTGITVSSVAHFNFNDANAEAVGTNLTGVGIASRYGARLAFTGNAVLTVARSGHLLFNNASGKLLFTGCEL